MRRLALCGIVVSVVAGVSAVGAVVVRRSRTRRIVANSARCVLCRETTPEWVSVLWQWESANADGIDVARSSPFAEFCSYCADEVADSMYSSMWSTIQGVDPDRIPGGVNHAVVPSALVSGEVSERVP